MQLYISTCAAMSTLAIWCRVVHSRDVSPYIFDGPAMSGLAFSVAPTGDSECVNHCSRHDGLFWSGSCNITIHNGF